MRNQVKLELVEEIDFDAMKWHRKRQFLLAEASYKCTLCGFSKTRNDGRSILEIDHIDGDNTNNVKSNLRVLCPNCHALTPNFRNWGRSGKTSLRFRKGNSGFQEEREIRAQNKNQVRKKVDDLIIAETLKIFESGEINFRLFGWIGKLNNLLSKRINTMFKQQTMGRKIRELMPEFYEKNCYKRI
jgi:hypothetical protein